MTERPRDWDKELADIDRLLEKMPAQTSGAPAPAPAPARGGAPAAPAGRAALPAGAPSAQARPPRGQVAGTWLLVLLVAAVAGFLPFWPYINDCGADLFGYLGLVGAVVLGALWALRLTWRTRRGFAHFIALATLVFGLALAAERVLPRIGYAADAATWTCPSAAAPATP